MVRTVPAGSVIVDWDTYAFTVVAAFSLTGAATACLLVSAFRRTGHFSARWTSIACDGLLAALAVATAVALRRRLTAMELVTVELTAAAGGHVDLDTAARAHAVCTTCAAALVAATALKLLLTSYRWTAVNASSSQVSLTAAAAVVGLAGCRGIPASLCAIAVGAVVIVVLFLFRVVNRR